MDAPLPSSPDPSSGSDITQLLNRIDLGDAGAAEQILPLVYEELRRLAASRMAHENADHTLQPTALVHEAWLRLGGDRQPEWKSRAQFFAAAAEAMRRILIDCARRRLALRRGGRLEHVDIENVELAGPGADQQVIEVNEALEKLTVVDPQKAELVKLRFFGGLTVEEAARVLGVAEPTARRWWAYARAWMLSEMKAT